MASEESIDLALLGPPLKIGQLNQNLTMMYIYGDEEIDIDRIIERFASAKKRRLLLL